MLFKLLNGAASPANCARKIAGPLMVLIILSTPPRIHDEVLRRALFRRFRSQEQRHVRNVAGNHARLQALAGHHFLLELRCIPQFDLPLGPDRPGRKRVHPYAQGSKFSRQHARQPGDGSFGHVVYREARLLDPPNNGAKIDNGASTESLHLRRHRLRREKHVPHVHRDPLIPIRRRDSLHRVAFVVRGIIDKHSDVAQLDADFFDSGLQRGDVPEVAGDEEWRRSRLFLNLRNQRPARFLRNICETHAGPLPRERPRERRTDTASSAGDEHRFVGGARVACRSARIHISQPPRLPRETLLYPFSISKQMSSRPPRPSNASALSSLPQNVWDISRRVDDPNDLQRFFLWMVRNPVIPVGLHNPEAQRQGRQVLTNTAGKWSIGQEAAGSVDRLFDAIGCIKIVGCDVAPDFKEIFYSLGRELVTAHAWRFSASQARFFSSSLERTLSESISSPRCAAA